MLWQELPSKGLKGTLDGGSKEHLEQLQMCSTEGMGEKSLGRSGHPERISLEGIAKVSVL